MTQRDRKFAIFASFAATLSVAVNMFVFQNGEHDIAVASRGPSDRTAWVDGPGLNLGPAVPGPVGVPQAAAGGALLVPISRDADDVNAAEFTKGIQRELNARGYEAGQPDGVAGLVTRAAIFAYEYDNSLVLTGEPSEPLLSQIVLGSSSLTPNSARPGKMIASSGESLIRSVKQQLASLGYQTGAPGGALTPELARAVREFEVDQKLKATGRISAPMMSRLIRVQGEPKARRDVAAKATKR
jgi:peptidoglycan hydrolase-like protein with peptidoglycan-binding domain